MTMAKKDGHSFMYPGLKITEKDKIFYDGSRFVINIGLVDKDRIASVVHINRWKLKRFLSGIHEPDVTIQLMSGLGDLDDMVKIINHNSPYAEGLIEYAATHKPEYTNLWSLIVGYGGDIKNELRKSLK